MGKLGQAQAWTNEFRGGGDQALRALTEKGPKRQRAHKVYAKIANCLKNSTMSVKIGPILEISTAPHQSLPRDKIYGPGGGGPSGPRGFPKPGQAAWATSAAGIHDTTSGTAFCLVSVQGRSQDFAAGGSVAGFGARRPGRDS